MQKLPRVALDVSKRSRSASSALALDVPQNKRTKLDTSKTTAPAK